MNVNLQLSYLMIPNFILEAFISLDDQRRNGANLHLFRLHHVLDCCLRLRKTLIEYGRSILHRKDWRLCGKLPHRTAACLDSSFWSAYEDEIDTIFANPSLPTV
jgi:hypothetical protein